MDTCRSGALLPSDAASCVAACGQRRRAASTGAVRVLAVQAL